MSKRLPQLEEKAGLLEACSVISGSPIVVMTNSIGEEFDRVLLIHHDLI
jgi:hypothetical protein